MGHCLQRCQEDQHVVTGVGPRRHICHRGEDWGACGHEVNVDSKGIKELNDRGKLRGVDVEPDHCGNNAGDCKWQEVAQSEETNATDQE